jgi:hypothetical protein
MVEWDITVNASVTESIELITALMVSLEQPGFRIVLT